MDAAAPAPAPLVAIAAPREEEGPAVEPDEAPRAHAVDLGMATFLRSGVASGGVVGFSPFVTDDLGRDVLLRIAASVGQAPAAGAHLTWLAGRLDACSETVGNYAEGSGLRLDLCAGADAGATFIASFAGIPAQSLAFVDIGPSVDLRAEVGPSAALVLRAGAGLSIARDAFVDGTGATYQPPLATLDLEVAFSWALGSHPRSTLTAAASKAR